MTLNQNTTPGQRQMAAHVEVVSADLRRMKVKVVPGTFLIDVLNEACKKFNVSSDKYELK